MEDIKKGKYRHYKGMCYELLDVAKHSETLEEYVIYKALYGKQDLWIRSKKMFFETIVVSGEEMKRFEYIGNMDE